MPQPKSNPPSPRKRLRDLSEQIDRLRKLVEAEYPAVYFAAYLRQKETPHVPPPKI